MHKSPRCGSGTDLTWGGMVPLCQSNTARLDWSQAQMQAGEAQLLGHLPRTCAAVGVNGRLAEMRPLLHGLGTRGDIRQEIRRAICKNLSHAFIQKP